MTTKQQHAAIQKWFSYIEDDDLRRTEIENAKRNIDLGILTYTEWVKTTLLINRVTSVTDKEAAIELLSTISNKIHSHLANDEKSTTDAMLDYYIGKHGKDDLSKVSLQGKVKRRKEDTSIQKTKNASKFFGNW